MNNVVGNKVYIAPANQQVANQTTKSVARPLYYRGRGHGQIAPVSPEHPWTALPPKTPEKKIGESFPLQPWEKMWPSILPSSLSLQSSFLTSGPGDLSVETSSTPTGTVVFPCSLRPANLLHQCGPGLVTLVSTSHRRHHANEVSTRVLRDTFIKSRGTSGS